MNALQSETQLQGDHGETSFSDTQFELSAIELEMISGGHATVNTI